MHYEGAIYRPPSEAHSILLQVTLGCSHNRCTFCGSFRDKKFTIRSDEVIDADISYAAHHFHQQHRLFLCDGDALIIPQQRLRRILMEIEEKLSWVDRVGIYGNRKSIQKKTLEELKQLEQHGLGIIYMGLESGDDETLAMVNKKADADAMIEAGRKIKEAGIKLSITVLIGLAGRERSHVHACETGRVLSAIDPDFVGALSLILVPGTPLHHSHQTGTFTLLEPKEMLAELRTMFAETHLTNGLFHANHASNYLPIRARLPEEKLKTLAHIDAALDGSISLRPEWMRGL